MTRKRERETKSPKPSAQAPRSAGPEAIAVRAVKTTRGKAATRIEVELEPERIAERADPAAVEEVAAEVPKVEAGESSPRWEAHPLVKASEAVEDGNPKVRYVSTDDEGCDASYGIRVTVKTSAGTITRSGVRVREADKPDET
jgi:hypothetical protein